MLIILKMTHGSVVEIVIAAALVMIDVAAVVDSKATVVQAALLVERENLLSVLPAPDRQVLVLKAEPEAAEIAAMTVVHQVQEVVIATAAAPVMTVVIVLSMMTAHVLCPGSVCR